mgnify:CR=1 FL=1
MTKYYRTLLLYIFRNLNNNRINVDITQQFIDERLKQVNKIDLQYYNNDKRLPLYAWTYECSFHTLRYDDVEKLAHKYLNKYLDKEAPMGEVFNCSVQKGVEAIKDAMKDLGVEEINKD